MSAWDGKSRGGVWGHKFFVFIIRTFGIYFSYSILFFVVPYFILTSRTGFNAIHYFFRHRLKYNPVRSFFAVCMNFFVFGQVLIDKIAVLSGCSTKFVFDFDGEHHLRKMAGEKTGGLLIGAHIGNYEIAGHLLDRIEGKFNIVMVDAEHEKIKHVLTSLNEKKSFGVIVIKNDLSHIYELNRAFENKEIVVIHGDRFADGSKAVEASFLDEPAAFPSGPFFLALKYNVPVSFFYAMKAGGKHYHFYASSPEYFYSSNHGTRNENFNKLLRKYIEGMEMIVKKYPAQWFNYYNFWRNK